MGFATLQRLRWLHPILPRALAWQKPHVTREGGFPKGDSSFVFHVLGEGLHIKGDCRHEKLIGGRGFINMGSTFGFGRVPPEILDSMVL